MVFQRLIKSFRYAFKGLGFMIRTQMNARIHLLAVIGVVALAIFFEITGTEWAILVVCMTLVLALEAVNTAIEQLTDLISPGKHPLAGNAKDVAAGAVLIAAIGSIVVALFVFVPKIADFFGL